MKLAKLVLWAGAGFFLIYGLIFSIFPSSFSDLVTGSSPNSVSGIVDFRATYGGMTLAVGLALALAARHPSGVKLGLWGFVILMLGMACARSIGIVVDGMPNTLMFVYLVGELLSAGLAWFALTRLDDRAS
ncbi:MAG: DUF4345 domain-containing protein [Pseudomonadales bacterium]|nr:DUF4345 domain-containing protein [Pseudomonadales bacterium]